MYILSALESDKLSKRSDFSKEASLWHTAEYKNKSLLDFWTNVLEEKSKNRCEFFGRANANLNGSQIAQLYPNLKIDENPAKSNMR